MIWKLRTNLFVCLHLLACIFMLLMTGACTVVKPYQRAYLEDRDMQFKQNLPEKFEQNVHAYREGAAGGGMGKSSGSCGCN
ncbi:DUF4266 domain-containing protein [Aureispira anguillae]|uniref:DUF4266 domain-containing protein n=1 Tax=Aureispira anguillae TaxID=2864201 RepID=A0A916DTF6_9BACT|nr:DUF4266 domain-containing protein [Aureispira anguillae]BDS12516.1 DUF4266 domain-containing protein [Aureispira anguillae]